MGLPFCGKISQRNGFAPTLEHILQDFRFMLELRDFFRWKEAMLVRAAHIVRFIGLSSGCLSRRVRIIPGTHLTKKL